MKFHVVWLLVLFLMVPFKAQAVDVPLRWDPVSAAEGYRIQKGTCENAVWEETFLEAGSVSTYLYPAVQEDELVLFRIASHADGHPDALRTWSGAWYNHLWFPIAAPGGAGIQ